MNRFSLRATIAAAALAFGAAAAQAQSPAGDAAKGKDLYLQYACYSCHGFSGQNGPGARLVPMPLAEAAFIRYVRNPPARMPSYSTKVLSNQQLADIYAYVKTLPASPPEKNIPLLQELKQEK